MEFHFRRHFRLWQKMKNAFRSASSIHHKKSWSWSWSWKNFKVLVLVLKLRSWSWSWKKSLDRSLIALDRIETIESTVEKFGTVDEVPEQPTRPIWWQSVHGGFLGKWVKYRVTFGDFSLFMCLSFSHARVEIRLSGILMQRLKRCGIMQGRAFWDKIQFLNVTPISLAPKCQILTQNR